MQKTILSKSQPPLKQPLPSVTPTPPPTPVQAPTPQKLSRDLYERIAFYIFLATIFLTPLAFWPGTYVPLDLVKTIVIAVGILASAILFGFVIIKEKHLTLPPKSIVWMSVLIFLSLVISAFTGIHASKSFFGQGFEIGTVSFILLMFLALLVAFTLILRNFERAIVMYVAIAASFVVLYVYQALHLIFGPGFLSFGVFNTVTSSPIGSWYSLSSFGFVVVIIALTAILILPLSARMRIVFSVALVVSAVGVILTNDPRAWLMAALVFLGLTAYMTRQKWNEVSLGSQNLSLFFKRIAFIPLLAFVISMVFAWRGQSIAGPAIDKLNASYSELTLPWQMTLDVTASTIKSFPLFGVGPNHFFQAYLAYKPAALNTTNFWGTEFTSGFELIPTFIATEGAVGAIVWILFFVFFGIAGVKALKRAGVGTSEKFILVSSFFAAVFLWLMMIVSVPSHAVVLLTFILTGIFLGTAVVSEALVPLVIKPLPETRTYKIFPLLGGICILIAVIWGLIYIKKTVALLFFSAGVNQLTVSGNADAASADFSHAMAFDSSDIYWQGMTEVAIAKATKLASSVTSATPASTSAAVLVQVKDILNQGLVASANAIAFDKTNYYNYLSKARVSEVAASMKINNGYENALDAYVKAINYNPYDPSIYLSLARLQANVGKLDDALRTLGAALQVKNNYIDAVFLLSQVYSAKGDLPNAIIAAQVATGLNPQNPLLFFQLGLLDYSHKDYEGAVSALKSAVSLQADYANAKYFLGLAEARVGNTADATAQFQDLAATNPDNKEISLILANLQSGKGIFADTAAAAPEKRQTLPIKQKQ